MARKHSKHDVAHLRYQFSTRYHFLPRPASQTLSANGRLQDPKLRCHSVGLFLYRLHLLRSYALAAVLPDMAVGKETYRSVTMSNTAPNLLVCPSALAACPSTASRMLLKKYRPVQAFGCVGMMHSEAAASTTRA
jgi:hypothetical protein